MNMRTRLGGGASPLSFAHLTGLTRRPAAKPAKAGSGKASGDDPAPEEEEDEDQASNSVPDDAAETPPDDDQQAGSASAQEEDDCEDDDEDEMRGESPAAQARTRERSRCMAILTSEGAQLNPALAGHLAFNTSMTRQQAIAALSDAPAAPKPSAGSGREQRNPSLDPAGGERSGSASTVKSWDAAFAKAGGRPPASK
jgi:hypothetical protein